jgi:hypothetical protein
MEPSLHFENASLADRAGAIRLCPIERRVEGCSGEFLRQAAERRKPKEFQDFLSGTPGTFLRIAFWNSELEAE